MLSQLYIKNVAVISEASVDFDRGLNVFTGETGAGKTILVGAINAVLGERTSRDIIRTGEDRAVVSALFTGLSEASLRVFEEAGYPCDEDGALISRELGADGRSSCKINGRPATASILKTVCASLLNVHGQHDNQQLLSPQKHLGFIDGFGELDGLREEYAGAYRAYQAVRRELEELETDEAGKARQIDLLRYQIGEIDEAQLTVGEEEELKAQRKLVQNAVSVTQALGGGLAVLDGDGESEGLSTLFGMLVEQTGTAARYMEAAQPLYDRLSDLSYELEGISADIRELLENFDCDPSRLDYLEGRLDLLYSLKKKYGPDVAAVLRYRDEAAAELEKIETSDERAAALRGQLAGLLEKARGLAGELSRRRVAAGERFTAAVQKELCFLDMPSVRLSVHRAEKPLSPDGVDEMELFISTNVGEQAKSLSKIASGGELARIMLSIKNVLADRDHIGTLIFDEVDTGVSGRAAQKIGQKLRQVAANRQVIVVTHLAQVASFAQHHLLIAKETRDGRTFTSITPLDREARVRELARIVGGEKQSEIALTHAREMLADAGN